MSRSSCQIEFSWTKENKRLHSAECWLTLKNFSYNTILHHWLLSFSCWKNDSVTTLKINVPSSFTVFSKFLTTPCFEPYWTAPAGSRKHKVTSSSIQCVRLRMQQASDLQLAWDRPVGLLSGPDAAQAWGLPAWLRTQPRSSCTVENSRLFHQLLCQVHSVLHTLISSSSRSVWPSTYIRHACSVPLLHILCGD